MIVDSGLVLFTSVVRSHFSKLNSLTGLAHIIGTVPKEEVVYLIVLSLVILRPNCKD